MTDTANTSNTSKQKDNPESWAVWIYRRFKKKEPGRATLFVSGYYEELLAEGDHNNGSWFSLADESGEPSDFTPLYIEYIERSDYILIEKNEGNGSNKASKLLENILKGNRIQEIEGEVKQEQGELKELEDKLKDEQFCRSMEHEDVWRAYKLARQASTVLGHDLNEYITDETIEAMLQEIPEFDELPIDNQLPELPKSLEGYELLDLAATDFPNRSSDDTLKFFFRRRCRLLIGPKVTLCVWESPIPEDTINWVLGQQCLPHYNIPRFDYQLKREERVPFGKLPEGLEYEQFLNIVRYIAPMTIIERIVINEDFGLRFTFKTKLELLQNSMSKMLGKPSGSTFEDIEERYISLNKYLKMARENNIRLQECLKVSKLKPYLEERSSYYPEQSLREIIENTDEQISQGYEDLLKLAKFIPTLQNELSKKFRQYASIFAIIFSAIAIAVAVYGENLREVTLPNNGLTWWFSLGIVAIFSGIGYFGLKVWKKTNNWNLVSRLKEKVLD